MKSMIVKHPLWDKKKPSKKFKAWYKKTYGLDAKELYLPNDKYWDLLERLYGVKG
jgi:hypothetical protein